MSTAAEFVADTVDVLVRRLALAEQQLFDARQQHEDTVLDLNAVRGLSAEATKRATDRQEQLLQARRDHAALAAELDRKEETSGELLRKYDRITLDLYHYIVELAGHRDTAKTKAERVALGHVVERLAQIRGMNDTEREAIQ